MIKTKINIISVLIPFLTSLCFSQGNWPPKFEDYLVDSIYNGNISDPDFSTNKGAKRFRTVIRYKIKTAREKNEIDLAGHFIICEWGCGAPCQENVIVDAKNGRIYDGLNTCWSYKSKSNSRLLIVNSGNPMPDVCELKYYLWENSSFRLLTK
jgi:hypothetical protein